MKDSIIEFLEGVRNGVVFNVLLVPVYALTIAYVLFVANPIYENFINKLGW